MRELPRLIPDVDLLLSLEPEELGAKMIFALLGRSTSAMANGRMFQLGTPVDEIWQSGQPDPYPRSKQEQVELAIIEAVNWLEVQGLIIPAPGINGTNGWRILSRRAKRFTSEADLASYAVARRLSRDVLHGAIAERVWASFMRGDFDGAVHTAMKAVEVSVRHGAKLGADLVGVKLMRKAFDVQDGPLTDMKAEPGERQAMADLFAGAIGVFKNPQSHRDVNLDDPQEATEIILLANRLLRIVDGRASNGALP